MLTSVSPCMVLTALPPPTSAGQRDQPLDWQTAPPVHVLSFMVLGSEKDAKSREVLRSFKIQSILNVTPKCPNYFEDQNVTYMRIAVADTGSQKLSQHFKEAFAYIEQARKNNCCILIHCMAGISRSVTLTIGYLMYHFGMSLQGGYQYVKERRPAISPNLNFMGQLVELENELKQFPSQEKLELSQFLPTSEQDKLSIRMQTYSNSSGSSAENTPEPKTTKPSFSSSSSSSAKGVLDGGVGGGGGGTEVICTAPFVLKLPAQKYKKGIRSKKPACVTPPNITTPPLSETNSSSVSPFLEQLEQRVETAPVDSLKKLSLNI